MNRYIETRVEVDLGQGEELITVGGTVHASGFVEGLTARGLLDPKEAGGTILLSDSAVSVACLALIDASELPKPMASRVDALDQLDRLWRKLEGERQALLSAPNLTADEKRGLIDAVCALMAAINTSLDALR